MILLKRFVVSGKSMLPTLLPGQSLLVSSLMYFFLKPKVNDIVIVKNPKGLRIIKRIQKIKDELYFVVGDNKKESTDSRSFGWLKKGAIVGKVYGY